MAADEAELNAIMAGTNPYSKRARVCLKASRTNRTSLRKQHASIKFNHRQWIVLWLLVTRIFHGEGHAMLHPREKMIYLSNINSQIQRGSYVGM